MTKPAEPGGPVEVAGAASADPSSGDLLTLVYDDLRRVARSKLAGLGPGQTLQATALVHEAWMRLSAGETQGWESRAHFFGAAARAMRNILVDQARRKSTLKRDASKQPLEDADELPIEPAHPHLSGAVGDLLALDRSLKLFEEIEPRKAEVVMLRFFAGLSMPAIAKVLEVSQGTVERDWRIARAWLQSHIEDGEASST